MRGARWGEIVEKSKDKGPYKLLRVKADDHEMTVQVIEPYGIQASPMAKGQVLLIPIDGDEGKMIAICMPPPADRVDQLKEGEVQLKNNKKGQSIYFDENGDIIVEAPRNRREKITGSHTEEFGGSHKLTAGGNVELTGAIVHINPD